ncbi:MAG: 2-dehydropantoate 2-reductase [Myxococcales bacterium]
MGAGSIGCYVGGRLAAAGAARVTLIGRMRLAKAIAEHGLVLREFDHDELVDASKMRFVTDVKALSSCDVVFLCVKSGATEDAARTLAQELDANATIVSLQNGLRNPALLRKHLPHNRVVAGVVGFNVVMHEGPVIHHTTTGALIVETGHDLRDSEWVQALRSAGIEVQEVEDIAPEQWTKLLVNLNNAVSALSGAPTQELILSRQYRRIMTMLLDEALLVIEAAGIRPARFRGVPLRLMSLILKLPTPLVRLVVRAQLRVDPQSRASMWQDLERRRPTEVDFLNGEIVLLAEELSLNAPRNRRMVELVREAERAGLGCPQMHADELFKALSQ